MRVPLRMTIKDSPILRIVVPSSHTKNCDCAVTILKGFGFNEMLVEICEPVVSEGYF